MHELYLFAVLLAAALLAVAPVAGALLAATLLAAALVNVVAKVCLVVHDGFVILGVD